VKLRTLSVVCLLGACLGMIGMVGLGLTDWWSVSDGLADIERLSSLRGRIFRLNLAIDYTNLLDHDPAVLDAIRGDAREIIAELETIDRPDARVASKHLTEIVSVSDDFTAMLDRDAAAMVEDAVERQFRIHQAGATNMVEGMLTIREREIRERLAGTVVSFGVGSLLFAGLCLLAFAVIHRRLSRPLSALQRGLEALAAGDLEARIRVDGDDELSRLARQVNETVERLQEATSSRDRAFAALEREQEMLKRTEDIARIGSWEWEVATDEVTWSEELYRIFGLDPTAEPPLFAEQDVLFPPADFARLQNMVETALEHGGDYELELGVRRPDDSIRHCVVRGKVETNAAGETVRLAGSFQDITERKEREQELRQLWLAVEQGIGSIMITDLDGKIEYVNPFFEELTGYRRSEVLGKNPRILKSGEHDEDFFEALWDTVKAGDTWTGTFVNEKKDGTLYHEEQTITPVRDEAGQITHFVSVGQDMTRERELEEQVRRAQRLESVGRLAGGIAHDFNNMVTAYTQLLLERDDLDASARQDLEEIRAAADRTASLAHQLLAFSRKQSLKLEVLNLNDLVEGMSKLLRRLIRDDIKLTKTLESELWNVKGDPSQLDQVLMNLAVNASEAMPDGGELKIETSNVELDEPYTDTHLGVEPGRYVLLSVTDTGVGMDRETASQVFEPFFTTKEEGEGTGLGLSTTYGIVKQHGGNVWAYSEPGVGTTFKIYLPRVGDEKAEDGAEALGVDALGGSETILVVEDDERVHRPLKRVLEGLGYTVVSVSHASEAVDVLDERQGEVDVLVTDVMMPDIKGTDLAERVVSEWPKIKVLLMSGYAEESLPIQKALGRQVGFLRKPFTPRELGRKIRTVLAGETGRRA